MEQFEKPIILSDKMEYCSGEWWNARENEQQQLREYNYNLQYQEVLIENEHHEEYLTRVFHWKIDFVGNLYVPTKINFHPHHFIGTEAEYDEIYIKHLQGKEGIFKITGRHRFDTAKDLEAKYSIKKYNRKL